MAVLDSDFLIALEQGDDAALRWLDAHHLEEHHVPDVVAVEYLTGHTDHEAALEVLEAAFTLPSSDTRWILAAVALRQRLRKKGVRFRTPDFWIAAWAFHYDVPVVTRNARHFRPLGVAIEEW